MIVGISGFIGCGKNTVADYLVVNHGYVNDSFAATVKDVVAVVFGWDRMLLDGTTPESRLWREQIDHWWANRLGIPNLTPRYVLQKWGTEVCRKAFHDDIWIASLEHKLMKCQLPTVISDCRFPNELDMIRKQGGLTIWVQRGEMPSWYEDAVAFNAGGIEKPESLNSVHSSEYQWIGHDFDVIVKNDGTLEELYDNLAAISHKFY